MIVASDQPDPGGRSELGEDSARAEPEAAASQVDSEQEELSYFHALEDHLAALRQGWLLLLPQDYQVARNWQRQGVPVDLVRRTMEELYARRVERGSKRRINSLRYFARAVEAAWEDVRNLTAPGRRQVTAPIDVQARLAALAAALPKTLPQREQVAARITALGGSTQEVEVALAVLDAEIVAAAEGDLDAAARQEIESAESSSIARLAGRLPEGEVEAARVRLRGQVLRRRLGLPVLSLFSPEAEPAAGEYGVGEEPESLTTSS